MAADRTFTLLGQASGADGNLGAQTMVIRRVPDGNSVRQKSAAQNR
jgi:hypothetical protein